MPDLLTRDQMAAVLAAFDPIRPVVIDRIRSKNGIELREAEQMTLDEFREFVFSSMEDRHQPGGDLEVVLSDAGQRLVGHHDGIYWLEAIS